MSIGLDGSAATTYSLGIKKGKTEAESRARFKRSAHARSDNTDFKGVPAVVVGDVLLMKMEMTPSVRRGGS
jgi:hypothetical protein